MRSISVASIPIPIILVEILEDMTGKTLPKPNGQFEWAQASWGVALRCRPLAEIAPHYFTTRELKLEGVRDDDVEAWTELGRAMGVELSALVRMQQVHGADVFE